MPSWYNVHDKQFDLWWADFVAPWSPSWWPPFMRMEQTSREQVFLIDVDLADSCSRSANTITVWKVSGRVLDFPEHSFRKAHEDVLMSGSAKVFAAEEVLVSLNKFVGDKVVNANVDGITMIIGSEVVYPERGCAGVAPTLGRSCCQAHDVASSGPQVAVRKGSNFNIASHETGELTTWSPKVPMLSLRPNCEDSIIGFTDQFSLWGASHSAYKTAAVADIASHETSVLTTWSPKVPMSSLQPTFGDFEASQINVGKLIGCVVFIDAGVVDGLWSRRALLGPRNPVYLSKPIAGVGDSVVRDLARSSDDVKSSLSEAQVAVLPASYESSVSSFFGVYGENDFHEFVTQVPLRERCHLVFESCRRGRQSFLWFWISFREPSESNGLNVGDSVVYATDRIAMIIIKNGSAVLVQAPKSFNG
jgi:hypothetical protein